MNKTIFLEPPKEFNPNFETSACFCYVGEKFLFLKRHPQKPHGNTWCLPAGKSDPGETPLQTVIRETLEETGIVLQKGNVEFLKTVYVRYPECDFVYHMFKSSLLQFPKNILLNPGEHTQYRLLTIDESLSFDLILGEHECIQLIYEKL